MGCSVTVGPSRSPFASPLDVAPCVRCIFSDISNLRVSAHSRRCVVRTLAFASTDSDVTVWHSVTWRGFSAFHSRLLSSSAVSKWDVIGHRLERWVEPGLGGQKTGQGRIGLEEDIGPQAG